MVSQASPITWRPSTVGLSHQCRNAQRRSISRSCTQQMLSETPSGPAQRILPQKQETSSGPARILPQPHQKQMNGTVNEPAQIPHSQIPNSSFSHSGIMLCKKFGFPLPPSLKFKNNLWTHEWDGDFDIQKEMVHSYDILSKTFGDSPIPWDDFVDDHDAAAWEESADGVICKSAQDSDVIFQGDKDFYVPADFKTDVELQQKLTELKRGS